jgi:soluble lytic murein transglycosylase
MKLRLHHILLLCLQSFIALAWADAGDAELMRARAAYDSKNGIALSENVAQLQAQGYVLAPYADYWLMLLNMTDAEPQTVRDFLTKYADFPFADRVRGEFLKKLGKAQDWENFNQEIGQYQLEDPAIACYAVEAKAATGDTDSLVSAKEMWLQPKELPTNCNAVFDKMQATGKLSDEDILARLDLSLHDNRIQLAKGIAKRLSNFDPAYLKQIDSAYTSPSVVLAKKSVSFKTRFGRLINGYALSRLAKTDTQQALSAYNKVSALLPAEDKQLFYARLAYQAAQKLEPQAVQWYQLADDAPMNKDQLAWFARAALREKNWPLVLTAIAKMDGTQAQEGAWRYWKARALMAQAKLENLSNSLEANELLARLSTERHFYGWLAQEELGSVMSEPMEIYKVNDTEVSAIANIPAFQRVQALQRMDMRWEAKTEWAHATQFFDDKQLLAAAEFALRKKWYDLSIITADKTAQMHDFDLRYPTPYRALMKPAAAEQGVDEAWVHGITRQESRFMHYAKSGVGAAGLMQLMPATAKWAAPRAGISNYDNSMIHELDTNIKLGTYYMAHTLDIFNGQEVMATAAYNAGPSRAKKWQADVPLEGAIYAETIPFSETRSYVQKVLANAHIYSARLGLKAIPLKQRLGMIPAKINQD